MTILSDGWVTLRGVLLETLSSEEVNDDSYTWVLSEILAEEDGSLKVLKFWRESTPLHLST